LFDGTQASQNLSYVQVRYAGVADRGFSCLTLNAAAPKLTDVSVSQCSYYPISSDLASNPDVQRLSLADNQPADEWVIRESTVTKGANRSLSPLTQGDGTSIPRLITGWLTIEPDAQLTLAAGVVLRFARGTGLVVRGTIVAEGAAGQPVVFTSWRDPDFSRESGAQAGDWVGLLFDTAQSGAHLNSVEVRYAGGDANPRGAIRVIASSPRLTDVQVRDSAWYPLSLDVKSAPQLEGFTLADNTPANAVEMRNSTLDVAGERVWSAWTDAAGQPLIRVVTGKIAIASEATLRLDPDVVVKFAQNGLLDVNGGLLATGAILTSLHDDEHGGDTDGRGDGERAWPGLQLRGRKLTRLEGIVIRYADIGLWLEDSAPQLQDVSIEDSRTAALSTDLKSILNPTELKLIRNAINGLVLRVEALPDGETRWDMLGPPQTQLVRVIERPLLVGPKARLVIAPGVVIKFAPQSGLVVDGELQIGQSSGAVVTLTALSDDSVGGDTDNAPALPNRGAWLGLTVNPNKTEARLSLFNVTIQYATVGLFLTAMSEWEFEALTIANSQLYGLSCDAASLFTADDPALMLRDNGAPTLSCPTPDR
jgi:hypothetical protein